MAHKTPIKEHTDQWGIVVNKSTWNFWAAAVLSEYERSSMRLVTTICLVYCFCHQRKPKLQNTARPYSLCFISYLTALVLELLVRTNIPDACTDILGTSIMF